MNNINLRPIDLERDLAPLAELFTMVKKIG